MTWTKTAADRQRDAERYNTAWRKARNAQLQDQPLCELAYPGICTRTADQADHILGAANDPRHQHLRSVCTPCHRHRTATEQNGRNRSQPDPPARPATLW